jgi:hypothetical protein
MANSSITLQFISIPLGGEQFSFTEQKKGLTLSEYFWNPNDPNIAFQYQSNFNTDYNNNNLFTVTLTDNYNRGGLGTVTITANYADAVFSVNNILPSISVTINNQSTVVPPVVVPPVVVPPVSNSVLPLTMVFNVVNDVPSQFQFLNIVANTNWTIDETILPDWLHLAVKLGTGNLNLFVNPLDYKYVNFKEGQYTAVIKVTIGTEVFSVPVVMNLIRFFENPFLPGNINFSKELKYLSFNSRTTGTYIDFSFEIKTFKLNSYEQIIYTRNYKFPLFQGKGDFHVGTIVHDLFEEIKELADFVPELNHNYYRKQYRPAEVTISMQEKTFIPSATVFVVRILPVILMAKGFKPFITENQTALLTVAQQEITRITPTSIIGASFICYDEPRVIVKKNNVIIDDLLVPNSPGQIIYSYFRFINNLVPGDSIEIIIMNALEARSQRFLVFQNAIESTYFFFENSHGVLEPYEFTGRRRVTSSFKAITSIKVKDMFSFESKDKVTNTQSFIVNTGQLIKTDHLLITALIMSKKVWCSFDNSDGTYFRVDSTTTKITNQDTATNEESFDIEFNILENANDSIFPR